MRRTTGGVCGGRGSGRVILHIRVAMQCLESAARPLSISSLFGVSGGAFEL